ncbi:MAG: hypothetical protein ACRD3W_04910, partial [Terriglobales bacterium]
SLSFSRLLRQKACAYHQSKTAPDYRPRVAPGLHGCAITSLVLNTRSPEQRVRRILMQTMASVLAEQE